MTRQRVTLHAEPHDPPFTCHFLYSHGTESYMQLGGLDAPLIHFSAKDPGQLVVDLRAAAEDMLRHADAVDGRRLDAQAAKQRELRLTDGAA